MHLSDRLQFHVDDEFEPFSMRQQRRMANNLRHCITRGKLVRPMLKMILGEADLKLRGSISTEQGTNNLDVAHSVPFFLARI
jgi:hypothetical protein